MIDQDKKASGFLAKVIGKFSWAQPDWLLALGTWVTTHAKQSRKLLFALIALLVLVVGGWFIYHLIPQPVRYDANITTPGLTPLAEKLQPRPVYINFSPIFETEEQKQKFSKQSRSVARLELVGKQADKGIKLSPEISGVWRWESETQLSFVPKQDWPAEQDYTVRFDASIFMPEVKLKDSKHTFKTPDFAISLNNFEFYQSPKEKNLRKVIATFDATHPVDVDTLKNNLKLSMRPSNKGLNVSPVQYGFEVKHDKHQRQIYIHSDTIKIPEHENYMRLNLAKGVRPVSGKSKTKEKIEKTVLIPSVASYFRVKATQTLIVKNSESEPEQALIIEFTDQISSKDVVSKTKAYLLPKKIKGKRKYWRGPREIDDSVLDLAKSIKLNAIPTERDTAMIHSFTFDVPVGYQIYLRMDKGLRSESNFVMANIYDQILNVPEYPKEVKIMSNGSLLSQNGSKQLSFLARGVKALKLDIGKVLPGQINHLISQTRGDISTPKFNNYNFSKESLSTSSTQYINLVKSHPKKAIYSSYDLNSEYNEYQDGLGLFFIDVNAWDPKNKRIVYGPKDQRLILITDLGILVKNNADRSHDIFVQSISTGKPVAGASIELLGKNGVAILSETTDSRGHATFPITSSFNKEKTPVVFVARTFNDVSFIPYQRSSRTVNYSRFDIGGLNTRNLGKNNLDAFLFTDRGIYRPGDKVNLATIIKRHDFVPLEAIPLDITINDPKGATVFNKRVKLDKYGFLDFDFKTNRTSPTGLYNANVYLVKNNYRSRQLGSVNFKVEEFQPDRLKIRSRFSGFTSKGWVTKPELQALISLENLFGTPAQDRRVTANLQLSPTGFGFKDYKGYNFIDPYYDPQKVRRDIRKTLTPTKTDDKGKAQFDINLKEYETGTYRINFNAQGYEASNGRSVRTSNSMLVSPLSELVGYKADGDLNYIYKDSERTVNFININSELQKIQRNNLFINLIEEKYVSTLVKQKNGTYKYQSIKKNKLINEKPLSISADGVDYKLPTDKPGDYLIEITNEKGTKLSRVAFVIVGAGNLAGKLEKNAELKVRLSKQDYKPGDLIEVNIVAPYTGAGLISIETNKVHEFKWFESNTNSSVQFIRLPEGLEGNAYINVAFVRDTDSKEIFTSPLSYAVVPFSIDRSKRKIKLELGVLEKVKPGDKLTISYRASESSRVVIFAVDEGILQVAKYQTPKPLNHFLKKRALEVNTMQIIDLILPEFNLVQEFAAAGGGAALQDAAKALGKNLNPFARTVDKPAVFWSGIIDADSEEKQQVFNIPDTFDGRLRVMAVAVSDAAIGVAEDQTLVRGPFVLSPNVLTAVAPDDEFDVVLGIANGVEGSGKQLPVQIEALPSDNLQIIGTAETTLKIDEGSEGKVSFRVKALKKLGLGSITFRAVSGKQFSRRTATLSVRPPVPYMSNFSSGFSQSGKETLTVPRSVYPDLAKNRTTVSVSPLALLDGLVSYLDHFPHQCTEQVVSGVFPLLSYLEHPDYLGDIDTKYQRLNALIKTLRSRQLADGGFMLWPGRGSVAIYPSAYVMHFLLDAKEMGVSIPRDMWDKGFEHLRRVASKDVQTLSMARNRAYAIYLLSRKGDVTTNFLVHLQEYLEKQHKDIWKNDIVSVYIAATYQLMREKAQAEKLIKAYKVGQASKNSWTDYDSQLAHDGQYIYLLARHFPDNLKKLDGDHILALVKPIFDGRYNTLSASWSVLAMSAYSKQILPKGSTEQVSIDEINKEGKKKNLQVTSKPYPYTDFSSQAEKIVFSAMARSFYMMRQSGFDIELPNKEIREGLEIIREYQTDDGKAINSLSQGEEITVVLRVRSLENRQISNVAVIDLLPGGFEVLRDSVKRRYNAWSADYKDIREDRIVFYGSFGPQMTELTYKVKLTSAGSFVVPPAYAEAMYDRSIKARSKSGRFEVTSVQ